MTSSGVGESTSPVKEEGLLIRVDNLGPGATGKEVAHIFAQYGKLIKVFASRCKPWVAYVHFEDAKEAKKAVRRLDMTYINGSQVIVKTSKDDIGSFAWKSSEVFVSGLGENPDQEKLIATFRIFGDLKHVWVKRSDEAFVIFQEVNDAVCAARCLDGIKMNSRRIKVQLTNGLSKRASVVCIDGLGEAAQIKELKDIFQHYGSLNHVWIDHHQPGRAYAFFDEESDAKNAIKCLDGSWIIGKKVRVSSSMTECMWSIWMNDSKSVDQKWDVVPDRGSQSSTSSSIPSGDKSNTLTGNIPGDPADMVLMDRSTRKRKHDMDDKEELTERLLKIKMLVNLADAELQSLIKDRLWMDH